MTATTRHLPVLLALAALHLPLAVLAADDDAKAPPVPQKVGPPPAGTLYHGVFPGGKSGEEDDCTLEDLQSYEKSVGRKAAWVYLSNNWYRSRAFPKATAEWVRAAGSAPFIRLMLRSDAEQNHAEKLFTVAAIIDGKFDDDLKAWGRAAKEFGAPLLAEWGTECNGEWFPWNGKWNGAGETKRYGEPLAPDGPERFVAAYRHIVETIRGEGALNVTWVWHVDANDAPGEKWNRFENYYPGNDVVDWIGVSAYGAQKPDEKECDTFRTMMDGAVARIGKFAPAKPVVALEFGCTAGSPAAKPDEWAAAALDDLLSHRWKPVIGFSWWNERWPNDDNPKHDTTMRVQDTPALAKVFRERLAAAKEGIVERPVSVEAASPAELFFGQVLGRYAHAKSVQAKAACELGAPGRGARTLAVDLSVKGERYKSTITVGEEIMGKQNDMTFDTVCDGKKTWWKLSMDFGTPPPGEKIPPLPPPTVKDAKKDEAGRLLQNALRYGWYWVMGISPGLRLDQPMVQITAWNFTFKPDEKIGERAVRVVQYEVKMPWGSEEQALARETVWIDAKTLEVVKRLVEGVNMDHVTESYSETKFDADLADSGFAIPAK